MTFLTRHILLCDLATFWEHDTGKSCPRLLSEDCDKTKKKNILGQLCIDISASACFFDSVPANNLLCTCVSVMTFELYY